MIGMIVLALLPGFIELPPQKLEADQCAMALWDRSTGQRIAFWQAAGPLLLAIAPEPLRLASLPDSGSGTPVLGVLPQASFAAAGLVVRIDVSMTPSPNGRSATITAGTLSLTASDGEARITPVVGIVGCG